MDRATAACVGLTRSRAKAPLTRRHRIFLLRHRNPNGTALGSTSGAPASCVTAKSRTGIPPLATCGNSNRRLPPFGFAHRPLRKVHRWNRPVLYLQRSNRFSICSPIGIATVPSGSILPASRKPTRYGHSSRAHGCPSLTRMVRWVWNSTRADSILKSMWISHSHRRKPQRVFRLVSVWCVIKPPARTTTSSARAMSRTCSERVGSYN